MNVKTEIHFIIELLQLRRRRGRRMLEPSVQELRQTASTGCHLLAEAMETTGKIVYNILLTSLDCVHSYKHNFRHTHKLKLLEFRTRNSTHSFVYVKHKRANV